MLLRNTFHDLRYALRQLRRAPGFAFTVVLTLALSVGVATAVFCVIDAVILRPLPYRASGEESSFQTTSHSGYEQPSSWPYYQDERRRRELRRAGSLRRTYRKVTVETPSGGPISLDCVRSTDNFFQVFGVKPLLGRTYARRRTGRQERHRRTQL